MVVWLHDYPGSSSSFKAAEVIIYYECLKLSQHIKIGSACSNFQPGMMFSAMQLKRNIEKEHRDSLPTDKPLDLTHSVMLRDQCSNY